MKRRMAICLVLIVFSIVACDPSTPTPPPPPTETVEIPTLISGKLVPASTSETVKTHVEFLIDNSNSMENGECGETSSKRYEFVNFLLDIFRTIPASRSGNFIVGAGSFGNDYVGYKDEIPNPNEWASQNLVKPISNSGTSQNVGNGIINAMNKLQNYGAAQKYLVIITDGILVSNESSEFEAIRDALKPATVLENLSVIVALTCSDRGEKWENGVKNTNIDVFPNLEDASGQLFHYLSPFLPNNSTWTSTNYPNTILIAGYYRALNVHYWNTETTVITLNEAISPPIQISPMSHENNEPIPAVEGCKSREYQINQSPGMYWLLFVQPIMQQDFSIFAKSANGNTIEVVNNKDKLFQIELLEGPYYDLKFWKDCFQAKLSFTDQLGNPVNGIADPAPLLYDDQTHKLSSTLVWHPLKFQTPQQINMEIQVVDLLETEVIMWKTSTPLPVQVKFQAKYDSRDHPSILPNSSLLTVNEYQFSFSYVSIQPKVFLITELNQDSIVATQSVLNFGFPPLINIGDRDATTLQLSNPECALNLSPPEEKHACVSYDPNQPLKLHPDPLFKTYTFNVFDYVVSKYGFTKLVFHWDDQNIESETISWECPLNFTSECLPIVLP